MVTVSPASLPAGKIAEIVSVAELAADPAAFSDKLVEVSGQYRTQPPSNCADEMNSSPVTWGLRAGEQEIPASGPNGSAPSLPPESPQITVSGSWQRWRGLTGCGDRAVPTELWYLAVSSIVSPNEIALVPDAESNELGPRSDETEVAIPEDISLSENPPGQETTLPAIPEATGVPVQTLPTSSAQPASPGPQSTPADTYPGPETTTATPAGSAAALTPTGTAATSTPGGDPDDEILIDLSTGSLETGRLLPGEIHRWPYTITTTQAIKVQIALEPGLEAEVSIHDPAGQTLATLEAGADLQPAILEDISLTQAGTHEIIIIANQVSAGDYAILVTDEQSYNFQFRGLVFDGDTVTGEIDPESDHIWHFLGAAGESIDVDLTPSGEKDLFLRLFDPDGELLIDFFDESSGGEVEALTNFPLPAGGLYSMLIGEVDFSGAEYVLVFASG